MRRLLLTAFLVACGGVRPATAPKPQGVFPTGSYQGNAVRARIWGDAFNARAIHRLGGGGSVDDRFHARIAGVELANVAWMGVQEGHDVIEADVPADLPLGTWDVEVQDPLGQVGRLAGGWIESDRAPPALSMVLSGPARVEANAPFSANLTLANSGGEPARLLSLLLGGQAVDFGAPLLGAGETRVLHVQRSAGAGPFSLSASLSALDGVTGQPIQVTAAEFWTTVLQPPVLVLRAKPLPSFVNLGQAVPVELEAQNEGEVAVLSVLPSLLPTPAVTLEGIAAADVPGASSTKYPGTLRAFVLGPLALVAQAAGTDQVTGAPVAAADLPLPLITVQKPAALSLGPISAPPVIDRGQSFTVSVTVANTGQATARAIWPALAFTVSGGAHAKVVAAPAALDLAGGASATLSWTCLEDGSAPGSLAVSASVSGTDANDGSTLPASSGPVAVAVQAPAFLTAAWTVPGSASIGSAFNAVLTVTNTGRTAANAVVPAAPVLSGSAAASVISGPSPASATIPGGGSATFTWSVTATTSGSVRISDSASGTDALSSAPVSASALSALVTIEAGLLASDPFGGDGTTFSYLFAYQGQVYLGPNKSGTGAVRMAPDGSNLTPVNWQLEVNTDPANAARNKAYQGTSVLCHTIGSPACTPDTTSCGPDNESGPGILTSGFTGSTEWYVLSGASGGGTRYLYMTNPAVPLAPGGYDDLAFVQIQAGQQGGGNTHMVSAARFFGGSLYFALLSGTGGSSGTTAPVLNVLQRMPVLPGFTAQTSGTVPDLVNLLAANMPGIGAVGTPPNPAGNTSWLMIDTMADFGGVLYLGNNGGLVRSATSSPTVCAATGCTNWILATPSAPSWGAKTSVTVSSTVLGTLQPAQRAIPGLVPFGGRLFAARNTTTGPQLWSCNPGSADVPKQCRPDDWSLVAGAGDLTQLGGAGNAAIGLLAATASHLYLGFNNAGGLQIWRTSNPAAAALADFTGHMDCVAGTAGCTPVGGSGLGSGSTLIFDGKAFTFGGQEWLYVSAGDGSTAPKITRIVP